MNKLKSYIGLCFKSNSVVIGQEQLKRYKKRIYLLILGQDASQNLKDLALRLSEKFACKCVQANTKLNEVTNLEGCKILGITNESLGKVIALQEEDARVIKE